MTKNAVVIGAGPGLGASVVRRFAREGFTVAAVARNAQTLAGLTEAKHYHADTTDAASVAQAAAAIRKEMGAIDVLVYNAGAFQMGGILDISPEAFDLCWKANCAGAFYGAQRVLPDMIANKRGTILLTGATASLRGSARFSCLAVGKFGLRALAQSLAREYQPQGIHVAHIVVDGQIDTPRVRGMSPNRDPSTYLAPDAIADTYWHLHAQHPSSWTLELDVRPAAEKF